MAVSATVDGVRQSMDRPTTAVVERRVDAAVPADPSAEYDYAQTRYRANVAAAASAPNNNTLSGAGAQVQQKIKRAVSDGLNSIDLLVVNATGNDVKTFYPFAMLIMSLIPVLILLCQRLINCMTKFVVVIIYALMLVLTFCMFRK